MKSSINPLLGFLLFQIVASGLLLRKHKGYSHALPLVILFAALFLGVLAMPLTRRGLEASLQVEESGKAAFSPTHIFVLGGGYQVGINPDEDLLIHESQRRVLHGIAVWHRYPDARLVFSGISHEEGRDDARHAELMKDMSMVRGVPKKTIMLETHSVNTREHPVEALRLHGVSASTPVGVVTSGWHMRRAQREFCHHFQHVLLYPVPSMFRPWQWQDFVPDAVSLGNSTTLLREWVGLLWYEVLDHFDNRVADGSLCTT